MPVLTFTFEVFCTCGEGLCQQTISRTSRGRKIPQIVVEPCKRCQAEEYRRGYYNGSEFEKSIKSTLKGGGYV